LEHTPAFRAEEGDTLQPVPEGETYCPPAAAAAAAAGSGSSKNSPPAECGICKKGDAFLSKVQEGNSGHAIKGAAVVEYTEIRRQLMSSTVMASIMAAHATKVRR
jgi:hypothetical protein